MSSASERVAAVAESVLRDGELGNLGARSAAYEALLERTFGRGRELRTVATSCAIFAGACLLEAGVQAPRGWPRARAITTWLGVRGFAGEPSWVASTSPGFAVRRGDIMYWCGGDAKTWPAATNGHVGIALAGAGYSWITAEGGGSPGGTMCRMSAAAKDVRTSSGRPLRGVWRPDAMAATLPLGTGPTVARRDIAPGMRGEDVRAWQLSLLRWRPECLPRHGADGVYGTSLSSETLLATRAFQSARGLDPTGIVDAATWDAGAPT